MIARNRLSDIRVVVQRGIIYSSLLAASTTLYIFILTFCMNAFDEPDWMDPLVSEEATILIGISTVPYLERIFRRKTNWLFFKDPYEYGSALERLSSTANAHVTVSDLADHLIDVLDEILHPTHISFWHTKDNLYFNNISAQSSNSERTASFELPLESQGALLGKFILGPKRSGDIYSFEDKRLLRTFAAQAAVAFHKAELYEELREYSHSLEATVQERTKDLLDMQTQQRQLFHDLSHALQTPITVLRSVFELQRGSEFDTDDSELATKYQEYVRPNSRHA